MGPNEREVLRRERDRLRTLPNPTQWEARRLDWLEHRLGHDGDFEVPIFPPWRDGERYRFVNGAKVYRTYDDYVD